MNLTNIPWKVIIAFAIFLAGVLTVQEFIEASRGDREGALVQYEVEPIEPYLGDHVLDHISRSSDKIFVRSKDIGN